MAQGHRLHAEAIQRMYLSLEGKDASAFVATITSLYGVDSGAPPSPTPGSKRPRMEENDKVKAFMAQALASQASGGDTAQPLPLWDLKDVQQSTGILPTTSKGLYDVGLGGAVPKPIPHSKPRVYECPWCPDRKTGRSSITTHMRRHIGVSIQCICCGQNFFATDPFKGHVAKEHRGTPVYAMARAQLNLPDDLELEEADPEESPDEEEEDKEEEAVASTSGATASVAVNPDPMGGGDVVMLDIAAGGDLPPLEGDP